MTISGAFLNDLREKILFGWKFGELKYQFESQSDSDSTHILLEKRLSEQRVNKCHSGLLNNFAYVSLWKGG